jgi:hypothetical protein
MSFKATQSLHRFKRKVKEQKNRKIDLFLKGLQRQNHFIDTFLRVPSVSVALIDSFLSFFLIAPTTAGQRIHKDGMVFLGGAAGSLCTSPASCQTQLQL